MFKQLKGINCLFLFPPLCFFPHFISAAMAAVLNGEEIRLLIFESHKLEGTGCSWCPQLLCLCLIVSDSLCDHIDCLKHSIVNFLYCLGQIS